MLALLNNCYNFPFPAPTIRNKYHISQKSSGRLQLPSTKYKLLSDIKKKPQHNITKDGGWMAGSEEAWRGGEAMSPSGKQFGTIVFLLPREGKELRRSRWIFKGNKKKVAFFPQPLMDEQNFQTAWFLCVPIFRVYSVDKSYLSHKSWSRRPGFQPCHFLRDLLKFSNTRL